MFLYKIGYGSYEDSEYEIMQYPDKLNEEDLHKHVSAAIVRALRGVISGKYDVYIHDDGVAYDDLHEYVVEELKNDGFTSAEFAGKWSCFGWPSLTEDKSWRGQRDEILNRLFEEIPADIKKEIHKLAIKRTRASNIRLRKWEKSQKEKT